MNIKWLEYLMGVVECGSITEASQKLYVSQPAITRAVKSLEQEYGIQIFNRTNKGIELTKEGKDFVYYASKVLGSAEILEKNYRKPGTEEGLFRLCLATQQLEFVKHVLLNIYGQTTGLDRLHFSVSEGDRHFVANSVLTRVANLGLMVISDADGLSVPWKAHEDELVIRELDHSPVLLAVGPKSPLYDRKKVDIAEVRQYSSLALDMGGPSKRQVNLDNSIDGMNLTRTVFSNSIDTCSYFLFNTDLVMYVSKWTTPFFYRHMIRVIPVMEDVEKDIPLPENRLVLLTRTGYMLNEAEEMLVKETEQYLKISDQEEWIQKIER